ncbi:MAG: hypothetical protein GY937_05565 [bacterium]|nr:hypothetical protein [bacterium]
MKRRIILSTLASALLAFAAGTGTSLAQDTRGTMTCIYEGKVFQPGDRIEVDGKTMICNGSTGTWVEAEE